MAPRSSGRRSAHTLGGADTTASPCGSGGGGGGPGGGSVMATGSGAAGGGTAAPPQAARGSERTRRGTERLIGTSYHVPVIPLSVPARTRSVVLGPLRDPGGDGVEVRAAADLPAHEATRASAERPAAGDLGDEEALRRLVGDNVLARRAKRGGDIDDV